MEVQVFEILTVRSWNRSVGIEMGYELRAGQPELNSRQGKEFFFYSP
jgi:hypothetical protein